jgi:hypothetical protein
MECSDRNVQAVPDEDRRVDLRSARLAPTPGSPPGTSAPLWAVPSTAAKRHLADLRAGSGLTTEQLIDRGRAEGWLVVVSLEP